MQAYLDTNVLVRLAQGDLRKISKPAQKAIERYDLVISPMVWLELQYVFEIGCILQPASKIFSHLESSLSLSVCRLPFAEVTRAACDETWTRDSFDRLIVAQARHAGNAPLITADELIHAHYKSAVW